MDVMQRRKATPEELRQGMAQMMAAQERLPKETTEEAIEDVPGSQSDEAQGKDPKLEDVKEFLDVCSPEGAEPPKGSVQTPKEEQKGEKGTPLRA